MSQRKTFAIQSPRLGTNYFFAGIKFVYNIYMQGRSENGYISNNCKHLIVDWPNLRSWSLIFLINNFQWLLYKYIQVCEFCDNQNGAYLIHVFFLLRLKSFYSFISKFNLCKLIYIYLIKRWFHVSFFERNISREIKKTK